MKINHTYAYPSKRNLIYGSEMVATSHPLASQAGLSILEKGGNAIDAAIAAAAALTVLEPTSNGIGGDAFAIFWKDGKIHGLNASGRAAKKLTAQVLRDEGHTEMPVNSPHTITVPGVPSAWASLSNEHGNLPLTEVLAPAIEFAEKGAPLAVTVAEYWERAAKNYEKDRDKYKNWFDTFTVDGKAPTAGSRVVLTNHANTLREIAETKGESFYRGNLAKKIIAYTKTIGSYLTEEDFSEHHPEWVDPISTNYKGYDVLEIPPNGQGLVVLMTLNLIGEMHLMPNDENYEHKLIEALKLAFTDGRNAICEGMPDVDYYLSKEYAKQRVAEIGEEAILPKPIEGVGGGTIYLAAADKDGNMISYIQSNYMGFGSGYVVPDTGIALHNRGANFSLDENSPNCICGGKRPYHTIIPGFLMKDGKPLGPFGIMGAFMQPQAHVQVLLKMIDGGINPQSALDAPRFFWDGGKHLFAEPDFPKVTFDALKEKGHEIEYTNDIGHFGRGQIILKTKDDFYVGATEKRCDGYIAVK